MSANYIHRQSWRHKLSALEACHIESATGLTGHSAAIIHKINRELVAMGHASKSATVAQKHKMPDPLSRPDLLWGRQ